MKYRSDIDGLRAIAVLSVIFYHVGFYELFSGGFVGVDIFFVISGFLITNIIYKQSLTNSFSLLDFYERRVRRIIPVFLIVIIFCLLSTWYIFMKRDFSDFTNSLYSTLIMGSNFFFWRDINYFAQDIFKPLLHTWSLAVEEQFYIIFPLFLAYLVRKKLNIPKIVFIVLVISFLSCTIFSYFFQNLTFYLLPFRAWELLLGALLAIKVVDTQSGFCKTPKQANIIGLLGIVLIVISIYFIDNKEITFPGYIALLPCLGALFCIDAGLFENSLSRKILGFPLLKNIGLISYSLYLWHWSVLVIMKYYLLVERLDIKYTVLYFIAIFSLSLLSYKLIEQPIRKKKILAKRKTLFLSCFIMCALIAVMAVLGQKEIIKRDIIDKMQQLEILSMERATIKNPIESLRYSENLYLNVHKIGKSNDIDYLIMGNSHMRMYCEMLEALGNEYNLSGLYYNSQAILQSLRGKFNDDWEQEQKDFFDLYSSLNVKNVLISMRWASILENDELYIVDDSGQKNYNGTYKLENSIQETVEMLQKNGTKVYIVLPTPEMPWDIAKQVVISSEKKQNVETNTRISKKEYLERQAETIPILLKFKDMGVKFIDPTELLCDDNYCYGVKDNKVLYYDDDHLSRAGATYIKDLFKPFFEDMVDIKNN